MEVNGQIDGELHCTSLSPEHINGDAIYRGDIILKSQAHVVGDVHHRSLAH